MHMNNYKMIFSPSLFKHKLNRIKNKELKFQNKNPQNKTWDLLLKKPKKLAN